MLSRIRQVFASPELRRSIFSVLGLLLVFRIMAAVPVPGVDPSGLQQLFQQQQLLGILNLLSGGSLANFSIAMLGVGPYITASIFIQVATLIVPKLEQLSKEGEEGRRTINQITRVLTVPLAIVQSFASIALLQNASSVPLLGDVTPFSYAVIIATITAGSLALMWVGEQITERGIGNGISLIIFTSIVAGLPQQAMQIGALFNMADILLYSGIAALALIAVYLVVLVTEGQRNIPVQYARRIRGNRMYGGQSTNLPLRVNQAGVIPIIFALSILSFPQVVAQFILGSSIEFEPIVSAARFIQREFQQQSLWYALIYFLLVVLFSYFSTFIFFKPDQAAENIQKNGGYIPGFRPGKQTENYIKYVLVRILVVGSLFLGLIAILPIIIQQLTNASAALLIGGTSLLIVVSVILETRKQVVSRVLMHTYDKF